ncbi:G5 domain-containing protein, partial [Nosocomiicoccus sp. HMSC059G07]|uniref:G5 domain-containing protein n=1 Tax=Nosocomiicoccus sp. HMSC059G07 TaxID=1739531 RepID=UPI0011850DCF
EYDERNVIQEKIDEIIVVGQGVKTIDRQDVIEEIPFETIYRYDENLLEGTEYVEQLGQEGIVEITTYYEYINGNLVNEYDERNVIQE